MLSAVDQSLFHFINRTLSNPVLDILMTTVTILGHYPLVFVPLWIVFMIRGSKQDRIIGFFLLIVLAMSDLLPTYVFKPLFDRPRPYLALEHVRLFGPLSENLSAASFPSNHATNMFALSTFLVLVYRKKLLLIGLSILSGLIAFSRIYIGVHYPFDVLAGAVLGIGVGSMVYWLYEYWHLKQTLRPR